MLPLMLARLMVSISYAASTPSSRIATRDSSTCVTFTSMILDMVWVGLLADRLSARRVRAVLMLGFARAAGAASRTFRKLLVRHGSLSIPGTVREVRRGAGAQTI